MTTTGPLPLQGLCHLNMDKSCFGLPAERTEAVGLSLSLQDVSEAPSSCVNAFYKHDQDSNIKITWLEFEKLKHLQSLMSASDFLNKTWDLTRT